MHRLITRCLSLYLLLYLQASCYQSQTYDRRITSNTNSSSGTNHLGDKNEQLSFDPNDPCGAKQAFGFAFGEDHEDEGNIGAYIVGGRPASATDMVTRSTVKVMIGNGHCSGTLIGPRHVVTAAHCFQNVTRASQVRLGFGENGSPNLGVQVTGIVVHPRYEGIFGTESGGYLEQVFYDVAVLTFDGEIGLGTTYYPVTVGSTSTEVRSGTTVLVAGYGAYSENDTRARPLTVVETQVGEILTDLREIQLAAGGGKGACYGDSGGPTYIYDNRRSCLKVIGTTTGPGRKSDYTCDYGSGTMMDITTYKGWLKCSFEDLNEPLGYLANDASRSDCSFNTPIF